MNKQFYAFLESLKTSSNAALVECIKDGYRTIVEMQGDLEDEDNLAYVEEDEESDELNKNYGIRRSAYTSFDFDEDGNPIDEDDEEITLGGSTVSEDDDLMEEFDPMNGRIPE